METSLPQHTPANSYANRQDITRETALLAGVAEAARRLLAIENFETAVNGALEAIAQAANIDRIFIFEHHVATSSTPEQATCPYEWTVPTVVLSREVPDHFPMVYGDIEGFSEWLGELKAGKCVQKLKREMSAAGQAMQEIDQALSVLTVPILIDGEYWGNFGFDDCTNERVWGEAEIAVLETAAATFAAALQRRGSVNTLRSRDELLDSVNAATQVLVANENLAEAIPAALQILGEGTRQDRAYIFENVVEAKTEKLLFEMPYEWVAPHIPAAANIQCFPLPADSLPDFIAQSSRAGKPVQFLTRDLDGIALALNEEAQALSLVTVPIKVFGQWWGVLGFDDCAVERVWSQAEIAVLETAAACLGSAIERDRTQKARAAAERTVLVEREKAAQARGAEIAKVNRVLKETLDTLATEPALSRFVGYVLQAIAQQFESPFLEYWRSGKNNIAYLELVVINGAVLTGEQLAGHHGVEGLVVPRYAINADDLFQRTQYAEYNISSTDEFIGPFYKNLQMWCQKHGIELPGRALNFPIVFGEQSFGAIAIFLPKQQVIPEENIKLGYALSNQVALAVQLTQLAEEAKQKAVLQEQEAAAQVRAAELEAHNQTLAKRDRILEATAAAANVMLVDNDFNSAVNKALKIIGQGLDVDRVILGQHFDATPDFQQPHCHFLYEWVSAHTVLQTTHPTLLKVSYDGVEFLLDWFYAGKTFGGIVEDLPEPFRSKQIALGVCSTYNVPITVNNQFWGVIGLDDCHRKTQRSTAELEALKTLANCIGSTIERDQMQQAREVAERAILLEREQAAKARAAIAEAHSQTLAKRDRILEATAAAANVMLLNEHFEDAVNKALQTVGEGLDVDRILLGKHYEATEPDAAGHHKFLFEWNTTDVVSQISHPKLSLISDEGIEFALDMLVNGNVFGGIVDELPDPFRSSQIALGVQSTYGVPVHVSGQYWGVMAFDDCHYQTRRSEAELEALKTLANCIGSAIERNQMRQAREAAEQAVLQERERAAKERAVAAESHNQTLAKRDRILQATATASNVLLHGEQDFNAAVSAALKILGESIGFDRIAVGQQINDPIGETSGFIRFLYEWNKPEISSQLNEHESMTEFWWDEIGLRHWYEANLKGEAFGQLLEDLPEPFRSLMAKVDVKSTHNIPIVVEGQFWGVFGIDYCHERKLLSQTDLDALKTAANCIGSAIAQKNMRQAREAAEQAALIERERAARADELEAANQVLSVRDQWLQATAAAANELLSTNDVAASVNAALTTIGENLECDRLGIMHYRRPENRPADTPESTPESTLESTPENGANFDQLGSFQVLYEWHASGAMSQLATDELVVMPANNFADWTTRLMAGEAVGGEIAQQAEPFRSQMQALGTLCAYAVPIFIATETGPSFWGLMFIDYCQQVRQLRPSELAVFKTAATCVGSAVHQEQVRQDKAAQERAKLLGSVAQAANLLLRATDYTTVLPEVTRLLGEAVGSDRCSVTQDVVDDSLENGLGVKLLYEWCTEGIESLPNSLPASATDYLQNGLRPVTGSFIEFHQAFSSGNVVNFLVADLLPAEKAFMEAQGNTSMLIVPIMVNGTCWGEIGFDNCGAPRLYDEAEIATLQIAAETMANAIARQTQEASVREAEERYRNLIELSMEGIYRLELDEPISRDLPVPEQVDLFYEKCSVAEANDAFAKMYGYHSAADMLGWRLTDFHVKTSPQNIEFLSAWLGSADCRISNSESEELDVSGNIHCFLNNVIGIVEDNKLIRVWGTQTDITALKQAQKAREEAEKAILTEREQAARNRATELAKTNEAIGKTLTTLTETPELDEFLGQILTSISEPIEACKAHLFLYNEGTHTLTQYITVQDGKIYPGTAPSDPDMFCHPIPANLSNAWQTIITSEKPFTMDERQPNLELIWPETIAWHQEQGHLSATCACMRVGNKPIGFIGFAFHHISTLTDEQLEFIQALTNQATLSIHLTRLAEEAKQAAILQEQEKAARIRVTELAKTNEAISATLTTLATSPELDQFLGNILSEMVRPINAGKAHIFLYDPPTHTLTQRVVIQDGQVYMGAGPHDPEILRHPIPADITTGWHTIIHSERPLTYDETLPFDEKIWWPGTIAWHQEQGHKAITCIPMKTGNQPIGYIGFCFYEHTVLTDEQLEFMQALANQAIVAIQLTRLAEDAKQTAILQEQEKAARDRATELAKTNEALSQTLDALTTEPELDRFLGKILIQINQQIGADDAHLFLYDAKAHTLQQHIAVQQGQVFFPNAPNDPAIFRRPIPADITAAWQILLDASKPFVLDHNDSQSAEFMWPGTPDWHESRGHRTATCACMRVGHTPLGFIGFAFCNETVLTDEQLEFIQALTNQATLAIQLTRLAKQSQSVALNAALTEERNRLAREIHDTLAQAFTGVSLQLEAAKDSFTESTEDALYHVNRAGNLARQGLSEARRSVRALRSQALTTDTLPNALRTTLTEMTQDSSTTTRLRIVGTPYALPEDIQTNLLRIGQEATTNVLRHAQADTLELTLAFEIDRVHLLIIDNGIGTEASLETVEGFGLLGMRERVLRFDGHFAFTSKPGKGTVIDITIPTY